MMPLQLKRLRQLNIIQDSPESSPPYISAASGLIHVYDNFYVIDDDSKYLACFSDAADKAGYRYRLLTGELPLLPTDRKKAKPDFESICYFEPKFFPPFGAILALPSGSKANRMLGALVVFIGPGRLAHEAIPINFSPLFLELKKSFVDLNIEGCLLVNSQLLLMQRGNGPRGQNAIIRLSLEAAVRSMSSNRSLGPSVFLSAREIPLGNLRGVNLSFTDAASIQATEVWFLAAAEDSRSTYEDGCYYGSVIGCLNQKDEIIFQEELNCPEKPEGIALLQSQDQLEFFLVTDADDPLKPSYLYRGAFKTPFHFNATLSSSSFSKF